MIRTRFTLMVPGTVLATHHHLPIFPTVIEFVVLALHRNHYLRAMTELDKQWNMKYEKLV